MPRWPSALSRREGARASLDECAFNESIPLRRRSGVSSACSACFASL
jgi:hypothetical protein